MICTEKRSSFFLTPLIRRPSSMTTVTGSYLVGVSVDIDTQMGVPSLFAMYVVGLRILFFSATRERLTPMRDKSGPKRPPSAFTRWQLRQAVRKIRSPFSALPLGSSGGVVALTERT